MSFYDAIRVGAAGASTGYEVERSLRFEKASSNQSSRLERTPSSTGNQKVWTWSCWFKRTKLGDSSYFISSYGNNDGIAAIYFDNDDRINTYFDTSGANPYGAVNERRYRDVGAWMHMVWQVDAVNTTQRIWINGVEESLNSGLNPPNFAYTMNQSGQQNTVGGAAWYPTATGSNMYLAEVHFSDGNKYTPSDFTETDATTGQLIPKEVDITYGTNGFYLNFSDNSGTSATTLGKDYSGNGNNWTPVNFSVSAGAGNDSLEDSPTNNFCTINPLAAGRLDIFPDASNGNLDFNISSSFKNPASSFQIPSTGKWYAEYVFTTVGSGVVNVGNLDKAQGSSAAEKLNGISLLSGEIRVNDSATQTSLTAFSANDIIGVKVDRDAGTVAFTINGSAVGNAENISSMNAPTDLIFRAYRNSSGGSAPVGSVNFGQRPFSYLPTGYKSLCSANLPDPTILLPNKHFAAFTYTGTGSSGDVVNITNSDVDFTPDWVWVKTRDVTNDHILSDSVRGGNKYLVSSENYVEQTNTQKIRAFIQNGFESGTDGDTNWSGSRPFVAWNWNAGDTDSATYTVKVVSDSGNKYRFNDFGTSAVTLDLAEGGTYTFDGSDSSMSGHPFVIGTAANGSVYSTGVTYQLDGASVTYSAYTSGYSSATTRKLIITVPASAPQLYYWCSIHSGMGGAINTNTTLGSSNFAGSIQSTVKANTTAGFSIVSYTGTGADGTVGHGLGVTPSAIFLKNRDRSVDWIVKHKSATSGYILYLNLNAAPDGATGTNNGIIADLSSSSTFSITRTSNSGNYNNVGLNGEKVIAYCFSGVDGYSKFGSYTGNGNANGQFIFLGFRPAWFVVKRTDTSNNWRAFDAKRSTFNEVDKRLYFDTSGAESTGSDIDFLSNGVKMRMTDNGMNASGGNYIYFSFAELPFKNSRAR
jgi:hypothetical protein